MSTTTGTYLDRILENTRLELDKRRTRLPLAEVEHEARQAPAALSMSAAIRGSGVSIIAEIKRASPSRGPIAPDIVATDVARDYIAGGAAGISVLTDERFFNGSLDDLRAVCSIAHADDTPRPVLRKDFVLDEYQVAEARAARADVVLLIVAALEDERLATLHACANDYSMDALVEIHDERELERALRIGATLLGINSRDLRSFQVDLATIERLARQVPDSVTLVGESGIRTHQDIERLSAAGVHAVLVGETLMRATDRAAALRDLRI